MTLIVRLPIIGRFLERWGHNFYPLNLLRWSQVIPPNGNSNLEPIKGGDLLINTSFLLAVYIFLSYQGYE